MSRELRYTLPGIFFAVPLILGCFRLGILPTGGDQVDTIVAILSAALLSFAAGLPVALAMGLLCSDYLLPKVSSELAQAINSRYGDRFENEKVLGMMVSTLHHKYLDEKVLEFLSRRQTGFYMAINSAAALIFGTLLFCAWQKWHYQPIEVFCGILFIALAAGQASVNYQHHHRLIAMVEPFIIGAMADEKYPASLLKAKIDSPRISWKWTLFAVVLVLLVTAISICHTRCQ